MESSNQFRIQYVRIVRLLPQRRGAVDLVPQIVPLVGEFVRPEHGRSTLVGGLCQRLVPPVPRRRVRPLGSVGTVPVLPHLGQVVRPHGRGRAGDAPPRAPPGTLGVVLVQPPEAALVPRGRRRRRRRLGLLHEVGAPPALPGRDVEEELHRLVEARVPRRGQGGHPRGVLRGGLQRAAGPRVGPRVEPERGQRLESPERTGRTPDLDEVSGVRHDRLEVSEVKPVGRLEAGERAVRREPGELLHSSSVGESFSREVTARIIFI